MTLPQPPTAFSAAEMEAVRACHRGTRNLGYVCCLVGVLVMIAGRFMVGAPVWLASLGLGVVVFGWGLLFYSFARRLALVKQLTARRGA